MFVGSLGPPLVTLATLGPRPLARASSAPRERLVRGLVTHEARPRVPVELGRAAAEEAVLMRVEAAADADRSVAGDAVALEVAAHARVQVALGLERVMPRLSRRIAPDGLRRVEPPAVLLVRRARLRDADAHVAVDAEALLAVAARAPLRGHPGVDGVHVQVVVRVHVARPDAPVVAVRAEVLLVAVGAERGVVGRDALVPVDE